MFTGFDLLNDRYQRLFMASLAASEGLSYSDDGGQHDCTESHCEMFETPNTDVYFCRTTGRLHECGKRCAFPAVMISDSNALVCPLTGLVRATQAKMIATGAYTTEHDSSAEAQAGSGYRKRKTVDAGWAERDAATGKRTGQRIYWIGRNPVVGHRAPDMISMNAENDIRSACDAILHALYCSEVSNRLMGRKETLQIDHKSQTNFHTVAQYVRLLCIYSEPFTSFGARLKAHALCLVVLYTWMTGAGANRPPAAVYCPSDTPWLSEHIPPRPMLTSFSFGNGCFVGHELFTRTDKFLQEVVSYWNEFAGKATREQTQGSWVPVPIKLAIAQRLARGK